MTCKCRGEGVSGPLPVADASFLLGLLMATMHPFLGRAAETVGPSDPRR